jgi:hypothetical protein
MHTTHQNTALFKTIFFYNCSKSVISIGMACARDSAYIVPVFIGTEKDEDGGCDF